MKKLMNDADDFERETCEGVIAAYADCLDTLRDNERVIMSRYPQQPGKVGIVTGGGSGHLPIFMGYVGQGMLDACAVGNIFASPSARTMADAIAMSDHGSGVLCLYGNYGGDKLNFALARDIVALDGIDTKELLVHDDVASAPTNLAGQRRGVAGMVYAFKIAGAASARGDNLKKVAEITQHAIDATRSMGCALSACIVPRAGKPGFSIGDDEIEIGMGIHGERGIEVRKMMTANELAEALFSNIEGELALSSGDECSVMVNGLGSTPLEEQFIVYRRISQLIESKGAKIVLPHVGEYGTSLEMAGLSLTIIKLDSELKELLLAPARTPFYSNLNRIGVKGFAADSWTSMNDVKPERHHSDIDSSEERAARSTLISNGSIDARVIKQRFQAISKAIDVESEYLTELDRQNGDGDLGISMKAGFKAICGKLDSENEMDLGRLFSLASLTLNETAPSSLGTILSIGLMGMAKLMLGRSSVSMSELSSALQEGLETIMRRTGTKPGEKTIIDALRPAIETLQETLSLDEAARAAANGSEATKQMLAKHGRAAYYGAKSLGVLDGGSAVGRIIFESIR
ncbi:Glycerone kinase [Coriobacterium glomerans PW2]|uniref:Glycerone kinase n=1 Tax=Coriobacterium glomerans (strain ATCC 49209 / DSM 20642 / JCM 10262 / PW2) TaxID=700015 RepID=F2NBB1_CORGP|nr:dihydroxyacetone kinase family protein [Coriobacterium glomerans]AEB06647.1 Glycerone kinase [Coriobacterium glomerans PW2]